MQSKTNAEQPNQATLVREELSSCQGFQPKYPYEERIDFKQWAAALWGGRWIIMLVSTLFAIAGVMFALNQPNYYRSEVIMVSAERDAGAGLAGMASQFGGLASIAGINLSGGASASEKAIALATLHSRQFAQSFIEQHQVLVNLMAADNWDRDSGKLVIDPEMYDVSKNQWVRVVEPGMSVVPTHWEAFKALKETIQISEEKSSGLITVSVTHYSPIIAQQWATWLVEGINDWMKRKAMEEAQHNIDYLNQQLQQTSLSEMQDVFYQLIQEQTKTLMLANVDSEYSFKVIDPAVIPEEKSGPSKALICILAVLVGGILSVLFVLGRFIWKQ